MSDKNEKGRWFSTGFLAKGAGKVSFETHALEGASVIQRGEAKGHGIWIDNEFCNSVVVQGTLLADKGIKARFGHPDMCSDALGTFLGKWKQLAVGADEIVRGNLYLSSTASDSPKGDLRKYVEELADKEPDHFGTSIVFSRDEDEEANFATANGASIIYFKDGSDYVVNSLSDVPKDTYFTVDYSGFKSPDPLNTRNFPHARMSKLHAADLVDDPAATDSMFSGIGGAQLASKVSEYLDTHPEVLKSLSDNKEIVEILSKYPDQIKPFIDRFTANRKEQTPMSTEATPTAETVPEATPKTDVAPLATEDATSTAETVPTEETKPKEEAPPPVGDTEQKPSLSREEFKTIAEKFGNDIAARYMLEKGDYQTALSWHVEAIEKQNAELKDQLGKFTASPSTGKPVAMTAAGKKSTLLAMCEKGTKGKV